MHNNAELDLFVAQKFGISKLQDLQRATYDELEAGRSGLLILPTGGGKSLLYQIWALRRGGLVVVLSPLVALMQDQVDQARQYGIRATCVNATVPSEERSQRLEKVRKGQIDLLFVTPERFRQEPFLEALRDCSVSLLVVDEAHCVSQWGHDFRPDYTRIREIRKLLRDPQTLGLTATATPQVREEIRAELNIQDGFLFQDRIERKNLALNVHEVYGFDEKVRAVFGLKAQNPGAFLVYASLISTLLELQTQLRRLGLNPKLYHGQMNAGDRRRVLREFQQDADAFLLATPAFGLGINKKDLRTVVHFEIPMSLESYYQEVGRPGRDGAPARADLLFDSDDVSIQMDFVKWANPDAAFVSTVYQLIQRNELRARQEGFDFLRRQMNFYNTRDFRAETSLNLLLKWGCVQPAANLRENRLGFDLVREPTPEDLSELSLGHRLQNQNRKLLMMTDFAGAREKCRMNQIENYFGQMPEAPCGRCDVCLG